VNYGRDGDASESSAVGRRWSVGNVVPLCCVSAECCGQDRRASVSVFCRSCSSTRVAIWASSVGCPPSLPRARPQCGPRHAAAVSPKPSRRSLRTADDAIERSW
jgi:hypothetical protein